MILKCVARCRFLVDVAQEKVGGLPFTLVCLHTSRLNASQRSDIK